MEEFGKFKEENEIWRFKLIANSEISTIIINHEGIDSKSYSTMHEDDEEEISIAE